MCKKSVVKSNIKGGAGAQSPLCPYQLGVWGRCKLGSRGGGPKSCRFLEHLEVFEEVLEDKMSIVLRSKMYNQVPVPVPRNRCG